MNKNKKKGSLLLWLILLLMTAVMLLAVGLIRGSFEKAGEKDLSLPESSGNIGLTRYGICFQPKEGIKLRNGDCLLAGRDATAEISGDGVSLKLRSDTEAVILKYSESQTDLELKEGSIFLNCRSGKSVTVTRGEETACLTEATALVTVDEEGMKISLYSGSCSEENQRPEESQGSEENQGSSESQNSKESQNEISVVEGSSLVLNEQTRETIEDLLTLSRTTSLCWTSNELTEEAALRERSRQAELQKKLSEELDTSEEALSCTITIVCDSIWNNVDQLNQEKKPYVPADGQILPATEVNFNEGDTVLDVLERVCTAGEIPLEYNYTPAYKSYYIEGINHLYEFDCGPVSGWIYKVNGVSPNYGCSSFTLSNGDAIEWIYTCDGLS